MINENVIMNSVILQKAFQDIIAFNNIIISESLPWRHPHVTYTIHDEIWCEWWNKNNIGGFMKVEIDQIWERDYSDDFHYFPVRVKIIFVNSEKIISEVIYSSVQERPVGMLLQASLNGEDPFDYKQKFGWNLGIQNGLLIALMKLETYKEKYEY